MMKQKRLKRTGSKKSTKSVKSTAKNEMDANSLIVNTDQLLTNIWWEHAVKNSEKIFRQSKELDEELKKKYKSVQISNSRMPGLTSKQIAYEKKRVIEMIESNYEDNIGAQTLAKGVIEHIYQTKQSE